VDDDSISARSTSSDLIASPDNNAAIAPDEAPAQAATDNSASEPAAPPAQDHDSTDERDAGDGNEYDDADEGEEEEEEEKPKLQYARLTQHLDAVYRNGNATRFFLVAGDIPMLTTAQRRTVLASDRQLALVRR
jgi:hypothetical protein